MGRFKNHRSLFGQKAFFISGGIAILLIAVLLNYAISPFIARSSLTLLASIVALIGLTIVFSGISYKRERQFSAK